MPERIKIAQGLREIEGVDPGTGARFRRIVVEYGELRAQSRACADVLRGGA